jgi:L-ascorbate metabolism protein UlaG (beta-lactamase superfamily)
MAISRRKAIELGLAAGAGALAYASVPARAQSDLKLLRGDLYPLGGAEVIIHPVNHASLVVSLNSTIIYIDPVGSMARYDGLPPADLVLVTHEHFDHFNTEVLLGLTKQEVPLITNPAVFDMLVSDLAGLASSMGNGDTTIFRDIKIEAVPAYNMVPERQRYHPPGRDNGYILNVGGARIYIAGDTEDIPEMRALKDIDIAFVPMVLPFTMDAEHAASAVLEFQPTNVYPYHYAANELEKFTPLVEGDDNSVAVVSGDWY